jgi:hypothetical protein
MNESDKESVCERKWTMKMSRVKSEGIRERERERERERVRERVRERKLGISSSYAFTLTLVFSVSRFRSRIAYCIESTDRYRTSKPWATLEKMFVDRVYDRKSCCFCSRWWSLTKKRRRKNRPTKKSSTYSLFLLLWHCYFGILDIRRSIRAGRTIVYRVTASYTQFNGKSI